MVVILTVAATLGILASGYTLYLAFKTRSFLESNFNALNDCGSIIEQFAAYQESLRQEAMGGDEEDTESKIGF